MKEITKNRISKLTLAVRRILQTKTTTTTEVVRKIRVFNQPQLQQRKAAVVAAAVVAEMISQELVSHKRKMWLSHERDLVKLVNSFQITTS